MRIGFACKTIAVEGAAQKSLVQKNATPENILAVAAHNLQALSRVFAYAGQNGVGLFRISSDIIPFGSSPVNDGAWVQQLAPMLRGLGSMALQMGLRLSMHPGQYTVLNSPHEDVVRRAVLDLQYHCAVLDGMGLPPSHKIVLHIGGVYGNKLLAMQRFVQHYAALPSGVRSRLVLENDDTCYTVQEVLHIAGQTGAPVVFDNLHHQLNPSEAYKTDGEWIQACGATWAPEDGTPKMHYSQQAAGGRRGAHSASITLQPFLQYVSQLGGQPPDVMLEVKDKNCSALKCILATAQPPRIGRLEQEWGRYKYLVMERDLNQYRAVRQLLKNKEGYPALAMFAAIENALALPLQQGSALNAAQHVWGYFKNKASSTEANQAHKLLEQYAQGALGLARVKKYLYKMALKYQDEYLLGSYYFAL